MVSLLSYTEWLPVRKAHLKEDLQKSAYTIDLFQQYKKHLGVLRFKLLIESQKLVVPDIVKKRMHFSSFSLLAPAVPLYKFSRLIKVDKLLRHILIPSGYRAQVNELDIAAE